jgi:hypothetical protein
LGNAGTNFANASGDIAQRGADAAGNASIARGNLWSDVINQGVSIGNRMNWGGGGGGGGSNVPMNPGSGYGDLGEQYFADGGPVLVEVAPGRYEPKVGTRSKRPASGGGNMGDENLVRALSAPAAASGPAAAPRYRTMRDMQIEKALKDAGAYADGGPVMAPVAGGGMTREQVLAALTDAQAAGVQAPQQPAGQMGEAAYRDGGTVKGKKGKAKCYSMGGAARKNYTGGGKVSGPGGPREDAVPAWLSDGEHVVDAASVDAIGGGDNMRGQQILNQVRAALRRG